MGVDFTVYHGYGIVIPEGIAETFSAKHDPEEYYGVTEYLEEQAQLPGVDVVTLGSYYDYGEDNVRVIAIVGKYAAYGAYDAPGGLWSNPNVGVDDPTADEIKNVKSAAKTIGIKKEDRKVVPFIGGLWH